VSFIHDAGFVHLDVCNKNSVMQVTPDRQVHAKLIDFGMMLPLRRNKAGDVVPFPPGLVRKTGKKRFVPPELHERGVGCW
jgi:hypothetical protein